MKVRKCPACGADNPENLLECSYCASRQVPLAVSFEEREKISRLGACWNGMLEDQQEKMSKRFRLFSIFSTFLILFLMLLSLGLGWMRVEQMTLTGFAFVFVYLSAFFLWRRRLGRRLNETFFAEIEPRIRKYLQASRVPRWQLEKLISENFEEEEILGQYLLGKRSRKKG